MAYSLWPSLVKATMPKSRFAADQRASVPYQGCAGQQGATSTPCTSSCRAFAITRPTSLKGGKAYQLLNMGGSGGGGGLDPPPPFVPRCRLFNIGPKIGPPSDPPFFACRPNLDPPPPLKNPGSAPVKSVPIVCKRIYD